jgi:hypothetical protein
MTDSIYRHQFVRVACAACVTAISMTGCSHGGGQEPPPASAASVSEVATARPAEDLTVTREKNDVENQRIVTVTVKDVDPDLHVVTFQAKVRPEANIMRDGRAIAIDQLMPGDSVKMAIDMATGEVMRVDVMKAPAY